MSYNKRQHDNTSGPQRVMLVADWSDTLCQVAGFPDRQASTSGSAIIRFLHGQYFSRVARLFRATAYNSAWTTEIVALGILLPWSYGDVVDESGSP